MGYPPRAPGGFFVVRRRMKTWVAALAAACVVGLVGCSAPYYSAMEKLGIAKRDILVDRIEAVRDSQEKAKEQVTSALDRFLDVTKADGGDLQRKYQQLNSEFERCEDRANEVRARITAVEDVAGALFREWKQEIGQYSNATLRRDSEREYDRTRRKYEDLIRVMRRSAERMDPVIATFRDQVLFLKHNLNARALASLGNTHRELETDINRLIVDMEASIRDAEEFIRTMKQDIAASGG